MEAAFQVGGDSNKKENKVIIRWLQMMIVLESKIIK